MPKWIVIALLLVAAAVGGFWIGRPDLVAQLLGPQIPELAQSHFKAGRYVLKKDTPDAVRSAVDNLEKAVAIAGGWPKAEAALAEAYLARADASKPGPAVTTLREHAFTLASEALRRDPKGLFPNRALAEYYRQTKAFGQMRTRLAQAQKGSPLDAEVELVLGAAAHDEGSLDLAKRHLHTALERDDTLQRARYELAQVFLAQKEPDPARQQLEELLAVAPGHVRAKALLDEIEASAATPEPEAPPAKEEAPAAKPPKQKRGLGRAPMSAEQLFKKADLLRRSDRSSEALELYKRAFDADPHNADILLGIGWCYIDLENPRAAIEAFDRAMVLAPRLAEVHMGLAEAYRMRNMKRDAIRHYQSYLEKAPFGDEAPVARRMIESLRSR